MCTHDTFNARWQTGAATLATALVLLLCTTLVVLYAAKQGVIEQWVSGNESRYNSAFAEAEAGLDEAVARFRVDSTITENPTACSLADKTTWGGGKFCTTVTVQNIGGKRFYDFTSQGTSDDNTASVYVYKQIGFSGLVANATPAAPIIADGTMGSGGNFNVSVNPNGGGIGVPVSIWTSDTATLSASSGTCQPQYMTNHACPNGGTGSSNLLSDGSTTAGLDIVDNAALDTAGGTFPSDVFAYLFGIPEADYSIERGKVPPGNILTAARCNELTTTSSGIYWIEGGGTCSIGNVGQADNPGTAAFDPNAVILVLDETELVMNANSELYGYVFAFDHPGNATVGQDITLNGGAKIFGSFLANYDMGSHLNGTMSVIWTDFAGVFANPGNSKYAAVAAIPGGWRDF